MQRNDINFFENSVTLIFKILLYFGKKGEQYIFFGLGIFCPKMSVLTWAPSFLREILRPFWNSKFRQKCKHLVEPLPQMNLKIFKIVLNGSKVLQKQITRKNLFLFRPSCFITIVQCATKNVCMFLLESRPPMPEILNV